MSTQTNFYISEGAGETLQGYECDGTTWKIPIDSTGLVYSTVGITHLRVPSFNEILDEFHNTLRFHSSNFNSSPVTVTLPLKPAVKTIVDLVKLFNDSMPEITDKADTTIKYKMHMNILGTNHIHMYWKKYDEPTTGAITEKFWRVMEEELADYVFEVTSDLYRVLGFNDDQLSENSAGQIVLDHYVATPGYIAHKAHGYARVQHGMDTISVILESPLSAYRKHSVFTRAKLNHFSVLQQIAAPVTIGSENTFEATNAFQYHVTSLESFSPNPDNIIIRFIGYSGWIHRYQYLTLNKSKVAMTLSLTT